MYCTRCGKQLPDVGSFCAHCGERQDASPACITPTGTGRATHLGALTAEESHIRQTRPAVAGKLARRTTRLRADNEPQVHLPFLKNNAISNIENTK